jgi:hypothetical protein
VPSQFNRGVGEKPQTATASTRASCCPLNESQRRSNWYDIGSAFFAEAPHGRKMPPLCSPPAMCLNNQVSFELLVKAADALVDHSHLAANHCHFVFIIHVAVVNLYKF